MTRVARQRERFCPCAAVLLLLAGGRATAAAQSVPIAPASPCGPVVHAAKPLGQWPLHLGPRRAAEVSVTLPASRHILLAASEEGADVEVEVTPSSGVTVRAANPVRRRGVLRILLRTDASGQVVLRVRATVDGGPGRAVTVRAYDEDGSAADACKAVTQALAAGDAAFAEARRVSSALVAGNSESAAQLYTSAMQNYLHALAGIAPTDLAARAQVSHALADLACEYRDQWRECERWAAQAAALYGMASDGSGRRAAQSLRALSWMELAQLPAASTATDPVRRDSLEMTHEALAQLRDLTAAYLKRGQSYEAAVQLNLAGLTLYNQGDYGAALSAYTRAQALYEAVGERYGLAVVLQNIALADADLGRASAALMIFRRALSLVDAVESPNLDTLILNNYGLALRTVGRLEPALAMHSQALDLATRTQSGSARGRSLFGIGLVYSAAGERDLAAAFLQQALDAFKQRGEGRDSVSVLRALVDIAAQAGDHEQAIRLAREALARASDPIARTHLLTQIADSESLLGRNLAATQDIDLAERIPEARDAVSRSLVRLQRGVLDYRAGRLGEARSLLQAALDTDKAFGLDAAAFDTQVMLARVQLAAGQEAPALHTLDAALKLSERLRVQLSDPELRATSMQPLRPAFDLKIELLARSARAASPDKDTEGHTRAALAALRVAERARGRVLRDISLTDYRRADAARVQPLLQRKSQLLDDLAAHEDRLEAGGLASPTDPRAGTIRADITHLREQLAVLDAQLAALSRPASTGLPLPAGSGAALPPDAALISYWLGESEAFAWLQTRFQVRMIDLGPAAALRQAAGAVHSAYRTPEGASMAQRLQVGAALSRLVLQPVLAHLPAQTTRLIIIPDGPLHYISFAALPLSGAADDSFVIGRYEVAYAASVASVLAAEAQQAPTQGMLLVADAVYAGDDPRLGHAMAATTASPEPPRLRAALAMDHLERLPATAAEAAGIAHLATGLNVDDLEGFAATRAAVLSRPLERYRYIHFAVHATTDAEIPQLSSLVLSTYDALGRRIEDRIWAGDLLSRRFNARTVVLSACQTALGRDIGGEGLFSLRYVVLARGAHSVIASLWAVPDRSTATLMQSFYQSLLTQHLRPETALTLAMRQMQRQGPRDPVFWAPFTATLAALH